MSRLSFAIYPPALTGKLILQPLYLLLKPAISFARDVHRQKREGANCVKATAPFCNNVKSKLENMVASNSVANAQSLE